MPSKSREELEREGRLAQFDEIDDSAPNDAQYNPDAEGFKEMPAGEYLCEIVRWEVEELHQFTWKDDAVSLHQLRPQLRSVESDGESVGCSSLAFLPMPTSGMQMPWWAANQWINFAKRAAASIGLQIPDGKLLPPGLKLTDFLNVLVEKKARVLVEFEANPNNNKVSPRLFGFRYSNEPKRPVSKARNSPQAETKKADVVI